MAKTLTAAAGIERAEETQLHQIEALVRREILRTSQELGQLRTVLSLIKRTESQMAAARRLIVDATSGRRPGRKELQEERAAIGIIHAVEAEILNVKKLADRLLAEKRQEVGLDRVIDAWCVKNRQELGQIEARIKQQQRVTARAAR